MSRAKASRPDRRRLLGRIALVLFGLGSGLVLLGLLEWGVRAQLGIYRCDDELGWTFRPDSSGIKLNRHGEFAERVRFDAQGSRDEASFEPREGTWRLLLLGDSIAASLQVPRAATFDAIVEQRLGARALPGRSIEVVNLGVDGYGTAQELLLLRSRGLRYRPDAVLLQIFISNDLPDNFPAAGDWNHFLAIRCGRPYFEATEGGVAQRSKPIPAETSGWDRLLRHSQLYAAIIAPPAPPGSGPAFVISDVFAANPPPALEEAWSLTERLILAIRDEARGRGLAFAVMIAPAKQAVGQLSPAERAEALPPEQWQQGYTRIVSFSSARGIPHLGLLPALRQQLEAQGPKPYFEIDSHWSAEGHRAVADALTDWLVAHCAELGIPIQGCGGP